MSGGLIHQLLERSALRHSDRTAVVDRARSISYRELDAASNRLARALIGHGVCPGERVGLYLEKSLEAIVGVYGVLKAGAVYVPLDAQAPLRRLGYIARDAGIRCLISSRESAEDARGLAEHGAPLEIVIGGEQLPWEAMSDFEDTAPGVEINDDSLAYILYTSGSTGEPKGVMLSHRNGLAFVDWAAREVGLVPEDRLSSHAPLHFDLSTFDLYGAAWAGASLTLVPHEATVFPSEAARFIREQRISVWYSVPSALTQLVLRGGLDREAVPELRVIIFAGEVFPTKYLARLMELIPDARYFNFYGPTETNVCTWYEVRTGEPLPQALPIGKPIRDVTAIVEREDGGVAGPGDVGQLLIRGPTVMHGYWGDPERTARGLIVDNGQRTYRTGDLVRELPSGDLEFLGRRDAQVKTRGYRVELGEVEAALHALEFVVEAAVIAVPDETIGSRLKAFAVTNRPVSSAEIARICRDRLPEYMVPQEFDFVEALPKSSTGKVDRRALQS